MGRCGKRWEKKWPAIAGGQGFSSVIVCKAEGWLLLGGGEVLALAFWGPVGFVCRSVPKTGLWHLSFFS